MKAYVTRTELQRMVDACDPTTLAGKRDRLLLVVLRALNGRSGEAAAVRANGAEYVHHGIDVSIGWFNIPVPARHYTDHLPANLLRDWLDVLYDRDASPGGLPLFRAIAKDDKLRGINSLTPASINQIVKRAAARAGLDSPEQYTARCMRGPTRRMTGA